MVRRMRIVITIALSLICLNVLTPQVKAEDAAPKQAPEQGPLARQICVILQKFHYNHQKLNDEISRRLFKEMFKLLDKEKKYFLKSDHDQFLKWETGLDDALLKMDLSFVDQLKEVYVQRVTERLDEVPSLLLQPMDFTIKESYETNGDKKDYAIDQNDLHERWRKLLKYQVLIRKIAKDRSNLMARDKKTDEEIMTEIHERILKSYDRIRRYALRRRAPKLGEVFLDNLARVFDPHSAYFSPSDYENFNISMKLSLEGIGAALTSKDGYTKVVRIIPGGPADQQGILQPEDVILEVAQGAEEAVNVVDMDLDEVVHLIRGKSKTEVRLTVRPASGTEDSQRIITIIRGKVKLESSSAKSTILEYGEGALKRKFGLIKVPSFYRDFNAKKKPTITAAGIKQTVLGRSSASDVADLLRDLKAKDVSGIIIDLRRNGGGSLPDAIQMAGLFIEKGPMVQVRNLGGQVSGEEDPDPGIVYDGPMLVLIDQLSASASEIFAAAMQDYKRSIIVGHRKTHGKGTVQTIVNLDRFLRPKLTQPKTGALKLTISKFYRITGHSTQLRGVSPDIIIPGLYDGIKVGEESLDYALPWDTINPADYNEWSKPLPDKKNLSDNFQRRIADNPYFKNLIAQSKVVERNRNETVLTLNEKDYIAKNMKSRKITKEGRSIFRRWQLKQDLISQEEFDFWEGRDAREEEVDPEQAESEDIKFRDKLRRMSKEDRAAWEERSLRDFVVEEALAIMTDIVK